MSTYTRPAVAPIIVERAEGHDLIDVDGVRYLDAISSLWVHDGRTPRRPSSTTPCATSSIAVADSTQLGNGNTVVVELAEALRHDVVPVDGPHFLFASDGAAAVEQALKIALQFWANQGRSARTGYLAFGDAYHGDTVGGISLGGGGFGTDVFDALAVPGAPRTVAFAAPDLLRRPRVDMVAEHAAQLAAVVVEPLVQGAAGMLARPRRQRPGSQCPVCHDHDVLLVCDEVAVGFGRTGTLFATEQCRHPTRPALPRQGDHRRVPAAVGDRRIAARRRRSSVPTCRPSTLYHGHSYGGNALAAAVALRHLAGCSASATCLANVRAHPSRLPDAARRPD